MPARLQIRVVPSTRRESYWDTSLSVPRPPACIERLDNGIHITHRSAGGVRVSPIGNHLYIGLHARDQASLEVLINLNYQQGASLIDRALDICRPGQVGYPAENPRSVQFG